jgi:thiol-disulfide isomerase/thioredoxin
MSRIFPVIAGLVILVALAAGIYDSIRLPSNAPAPPAPVASSSEATGGLTLLDEPRPMPMLQFTNGEGRKMTLADFRGRVVLLNIWATWCVPCREEMPTLERLQEKLSSDEFEVVVLSIDQGGAAAVQSFYTEIGIHHLDVYIDTSGKVARDLNIIGLPTTLLIDRKGRELARLIGPAVWDGPEIVSVIKSVVVESPTAEGGAEWAPQRFTTHFDAASREREAAGQQQ